MARLYPSLEAVLAAILVAACGGEPAAQPRTGADEAPVSGTQGTTTQTVRACDLVNLAAATRVIGPGTTHPGGDMEEQTCMYSNAGVATLTIQIGGAELYDAITILPPHTSVQIGDRGRYNVQETGRAAVQFAKGRYSITMGTQPIGVTQTEFIDKLLIAALEAADRLP